VNVVPDNSPGAASACVAVTVAGVTVEGVTVEGFIAAGDGGTIFGRLSVEGTDVDGTIAEGAVVEAPIVGWAIVGWAPWASSNVSAKFCTSADVLPEPSTILDIWLILMRHKGLNTIFRLSLFAKIVNQNRFDL
jgi:hypothetical protein